MSARGLSLLEMILRLSRDQVPVDGSNWVDSRRDAQAVRERAPDADWSPLSLTLFRPIGRPQRKSV